MIKWHARWRFLMRRYCKNCRALIILSAFICILSCIFLTGCAETAPTEEAELDEAIVSYLNMTQQQAEAMTASVQNIDLTSQGKDSTLHVRQTFGSQYDLYVLFDVTFHEEIPIDDPDRYVFMNVNFAPKNARLPHSGGLFTLAQEGQTVTYLSYFNSRGYEGDVEKPWPKGKLNFTIEHLESFDMLDVQDRKALTQDKHTISWDPSNTSEVLYQTFEENGQTGSVRLTPFSLYVDLNKAQPKQGESLGDILKWIHPDGTRTPISYPDMGYEKNEDGFRSVSLSDQFQPPLELSSVKGIEINGCSVMF